MKIISLGAGVQSTALLVMSDRGEIDRADYAVFADTGAEPKKVYEWLDFIETKVSIPIVRCAKGNLYEDIMAGGRTASLPLHTLNDDGTQGMIMRQCTFDYKITPIQKAVRELMGYKKYQRIKETAEMFIGISTDEIHRVKPSKVRWIKHRWPLIEKKLSRTDCIKYVEQTLGHTPPRSSCVFCPFHDDEEWLRVKNGPADEWQKVIDIENRLNTLDKFKSKVFLHRARKPIDQVEFKIEDDQLDLFGNECEGMCGV